jgi:hypothetical protein
VSGSIARTRFVLAVVIAVGRRPSLWVIAIRQMLLLAPRGWIRRFPFLPLPSQDYLAFRSVTQYGKGDHPPRPQDVVEYLTWCAQMRRIASE